MGRWGDESPERSTGSAKVTQHGSDQRQRRQRAIVFLKDGDKPWGIPSNCCLLQCSEARCLSSNLASAAS